jgi:hypothetical protein
MRFKSRRFLLTSISETAEERAAERDLRFEDRGLRALEAEYYE